MDELKDIEVGGNKSQVYTLQADQLQANQPQTDVPADPELMEDLEDLTIDEPVIEPITSETLKHTYCNTFTDQL